MRDKIIDRTINQSKDFDPKIPSSNITGTTVLVTGASGLVGSHLVKRLLDEGQKVKAIYRSGIPDINAREI